MGKKLYMVDHDTGKSHLMATFKMVDGKVMSAWEKGWQLFRDELEDYGIATAAGVFKPKDGQKFLDNLRLAYSQSTNVYVKDA